MAIVRSAVKHLTPRSALLDGEEVNLDTAQTALQNLLGYTTSEAQRLWVTNQTLLESAILAAGAKKISYKRQFYRDSGATSIMTPIEGAMIGNLRELVEFKVISEAESWVKNTDPHKQAFQFGATLDLSATGDQFSKRFYSRTENTVSVSLRCLEIELLLVFVLPEHLRTRSLTKLSKPRLRWNGSMVVFDFTIFEEVTAKTGKLRAGVDLGRVEPYYATVTATDGARVAEYKASAGLKAGWDKYHRLRQQAVKLRAKIEAKERLGLSTEILTIEADRLRSKKTRLHSELSKRQAYELASKLERHPIGTVNVEKLSWLAGSKGKTSKGGRWSYGRQQSDLAHALARRGIQQKVVSPKNSSQLCYRCGVTVIHNSKQRTVQCLDCKTVLDRDFNAAMNIATLNHLRTTEWLAKFYGLSEDNCTGKPEVMTECASPQAFSGSTSATQVARVTT